MLQIFSQCAFDFMFFFLILNFNCYVITLFLIFSFTTSGFYIILRKDFPEEVIKNSPMPSFF